MSSTTYEEIVSKLDYLEMTDPDYINNEEYINYAREESILEGCDMSIIDLTPTYPDNNNYAATRYQLCIFFDGIDKLYYDALEKHKNNEKTIDYIDGISRFRYSPFYPITIFDGIKTYYIDNVSPEAACAKISNQLSTCHKCKKTYESLIKIFINDKSEILMLNHHILHLITHHDHVDYFSTISLDILIKFFGNLFFQMLPTLI